MLSSARLRQRLDEHADALLPHVYQSTIDFLAHAQVPLTTGNVALDIDVYPMNNKKPARKASPELTKGLTATLRLPSIWTKRVGASATNCGKAGSIANMNSAIHWNAD